MRNQYFTTTLFQTYFMVLMLFVLGCTTEKRPQQAPDRQETEQRESIVEDRPTSPPCDIERKGQQVMNKLLVQVENMSAAVNKLHEVVEKHNHEEMTKHSKEIEVFTLDLMSQTTILPLDNFNMLQEYSKDVLERSSQYVWKNKYFNVQKNYAIFRELEGDLDVLKGNIKGMSDLPATICETDKNIAIKGAFSHLNIMDVYIEQIDRTLEKECFDCIEDFCEKLENTLKIFRETITNINTDDFTTINRTLADIEHSAHEMKEKSASKDQLELHHTHETILRQMKRLKEEVDEIS